MSGWARKTFNKFGALTDTSDLVGDNVDVELTKIFNVISKVTVDELKDLLKKGKDGERPYEHADDQFIEFATEAFVHKNIRVRPISGVTDTKDRHDGRASEVSRGGIEDEDNEANDKNMQQFHMDDMRQEAKMKKRRNEEARAKKAA